MAEQLFPDELQQRYEQILAQTKKLQEQLGVTPRTLEQRYRDYLVRKAEEEKQKVEKQRREEELKKLNALVRPKLSFKKP